MKISLGHNITTIYFLFNMFNMFLQKLRFKIYFSSLYYFCSLKKKPSKFVRKNETIK